MSLTNVTLVNNTASGPDEPGGGGIYLDGTDLAIVDSTIAGNSAAFVGGGIDAVAAGQVLVSEVSWPATRRLTKRTKETLG